MISIYFFSLKLSIHECVNTYFKICFSPKPICVGVDTVDCFNNIHSHSHECITVDYKKKV